MARTRPRAEQGLAPGVPGEVYGKRGNIKVPGSLQTGAVDELAEWNAAAAQTEADRPGPFDPDTADYHAAGSERTSN